MNYLALPDLDILSRWVLDAKRLMPFFISIIPVHLGNRFFMAMMINNQFDFGEVVYLKTDKDQNPRIVYMFKVFKNEILYELACGTTVSTHYEFEISKEVNILMHTTN